jgi:hypothetical protein
MSHTTARETASNARLDSLPLLANGFAIRVWLESRTLKTVALNATLASLGLEWVPAKYVQLDMHSLKTARHFVFLAFQERTRTKQERHHVNNAQKMKKAKTPVRRNAILAEKVNSQILAVLNVQNVTQEKLVRRVKLVKQACTEILPWMQIIVHCVPLDVTRVVKDRPVAFHAFQANSRTKQENHRANHAQPTKRVRTPVLRNVRFVQMVKSPNPAVLNVRNATREKQEHRVNHVKKGNIVMLPCLPSGVAAAPRRAWGRWSCGTNRVLRESLVEELSL